MCRTVRERADEAAKLVPDDIHSPVAALIVPVIAKNFMGGLSSAINNIKAHAKIVRLCFEKEVREGVVTPGEAAAAWEALKDMAIHAREMATILEQLAEEAPIKSSRDVSNLTMDDMKNCPELPDCYVVQNGKAKERRPGDVNPMGLLEAFEEEIRKPKGDDDFLKDLGIG